MSEGSAKKDTKDIDELIRQTLREENAEWFSEWDDQSLTEMVIDSFRGKSKWLVVGVYVSALVFLILMIIATVQFFRAETTRQMIFFATGFLFCNISIAMLKTWYWMELNKNAVTREIKKIELQRAMDASRSDRAQELENQ